MVEGDTEIAVFKAAAKLCKIDPHAERNTTLINCRGKRTIPAFMRVLNHFGKRYFVLHDKDGNASFNKKIAELAKERKLGSVKLFVNDLEEAIGLGSQGSKFKDKPIRAIREVRRLHKTGLLEKKLGEYVKYIYGL